MKDYLITTNKNEQKKLSELTGPKGLVIFFYPAAMTQWCTKEVIEYQNRVGDFMAAGFKIAGASPDKVKEQNQFSCENNLFYPLICDSEFEMINDLGINGDSDGENPGKIIRSTFILDKNLKILQQIKVEDQFSATHVSEMIKLCKTSF